MKEINVFVASSSELRNERLNLSRSVRLFNQKIRNKDIQVIAKKWEHLDSAVGVEHKQAEYNKVLKKCDLCIAMFWRNFGEYTKEEFDVAYNEVKQGNKLKKVLVFFKEAKEEEISAGLNEFKNTFSQNYNCDSPLFFKDVQELDALFIKTMENFIG